MIAASDMTEERKSNRSEPDLFWADMRGGSRKGRRFRPTTRWSACGRLAPTSPDLRNRAFDPFRSVMSGCYGAAGIRTGHCIKRVQPPVCSSRIINQIRKFFRLAIPTGSQQEHSKQLGAIFPGSLRLRAPQIFSQAFFQELPKFES